MNNHDLQLVFTDRIIKWNAVRREPVFDLKLCMNMMLEEVEELIFADSPIEALDAVGDIVFVGVGELWKLGFTDIALSGIFYEDDIRGMTIADLYNHTTIIKDYSIYNIEGIEEDNRFLGVDIVCNAVFMQAIPSLMSMGMQSAFYDIVHAICDSNDTKDIVRVGSAVKSSKGPNFKPPTDKLIRLRESTVRQDSKIVKGVIN
jgi:hypothetical protein